MAYSPVTSGLLPGIMRAEMLDAGMLEERVLTLGDFLLTRTHTHTHAHPPIHPHEHTH